MVTIKMVIFDPEISGNVVKGDIQMSGTVNEVKDRLNAMDETPGAVVPTAPPPEPAPVEDATGAGSVVEDDPPVDAGEEEAS